MLVGILTFQILLDNSRSLKNKRSKIKPLIHQLHKKFNVSVAEIGCLENWSQSIIACVIVGNEKRFLEKSLQEVLKYLESNFLDMQFADIKIEIW